MERGIGIRRAVRRDEQMRARKIRRIDRRELDLHRPLPQLRCRRRSAACLRFRRTARDRPCLCARATAGQRFRFGLLLVGKHGRLVISRSLPLHKADRPRRAGGQAVAKAVAIVIPHQARLAVHHADGSFMAGFCTKAAAIAFIFIDLNNSSDHVFFLLYS